MEYLLLIHTDPAGFAALTPAQQKDGAAAYFAYTDALRKAGVYVGSNRLQPVSTATTVRVKDGKTQLVNGPYAEVKEELGGYYLIDVPDLDAALSWAARCPATAHGAVEVRPVFSM